MINSQPPTSFSAAPPPLPSSSSSSSSSSSHSTMILLLVVVVILVATIFLCCLFCMVLRYFIKRSSSPVFQTSSRRLESFSSRILRRQLQQLFRLHDSGLDQAVIDSLPVFCCKDIIVGNSNVQFDCAICLSVFSEQDRLRLLPVCGHAFHMDCIDTWLLSNSTCPLCRGTLFSSGLVVENSVLNFDDSRAMSSRYNGDGDKSDNGTPSVEDGVVEKQVFSVRLGKFRSSILNEELGETSSCYIDARRCYSMGTYQYVVGDSDLQVALPHACGGGIDAKLDVDGGHFKMSGNLEGKKIIGCYKGESFSLSKIWLWSKKNKFPDSLNTHTCMPSFSVTS